MKRIILKILATIVATIILGIIYFNIYNSSKIDQRIMFFIVFGSIMILIYVVLMIFYNELEQLQNYIKTHTFKEFYEDYLEKNEDKLEKCKTKIEEIVKEIINLLKKFYNSKINKFINTIAKLCVLTGIWYKIFFEEDFYSRIVVFVIFIIMLFYATINNIIDAIISHKRSDFIFAVTYISITCIEIFYALLVYL